MSSHHHEIGRVVLRIGIGAMFILHGWPKLSGGPRTWKKLGGAMKSVGIDFAPEFWGFMAAFSEVFGGLAFALGLLFQPACVLLFITMVVAATMHLRNGDGLGGSSHAIESAIVFASAFLLGPGRYSIKAPRLRR